MRKQRSSQFDLEHKNVYKEQLNLTEQTINNTNLHSHSHRRHQHQRKLVRTINHLTTVKIENSPQRDYIVTTVGKDVQLDCKMKNLSKDDDKVKKNLIKIGFFVLLI